MKKILIYTRKGGVGKTYTTVHLAGCLEKVFKKKVLIIDADAQGNTTSKLADIEKSGNFNITNLFTGKVDYTNIIQRVYVPDKKNEGLIETNIDIIPGAHEIDNVESTDMYILKDFLDVYENTYDYCLIDCSPSLTNVTINAMCAADYILIPAFANSDSINGYGMVIEEIDRMKENGFNVNIKVLGVFLNAVDKRRGAERYYKSVWEETKGNISIFDTQIRDSADMVNAYEFCKPIHYYKPSCPGARDYDSLAREIFKKIEDIETGGNN